MIKVTGDEYEEARFKWDWHALPGITEELRDDDLPKSEKNNDGDPEKNCGGNDFAGGVSDGRFGMAAFECVCV